jgi:heme-degrading monooxygenase HmoA
MLVILFRSKLTAQAGDDYGRMATAMAAHARTFPGFVDVKSFTADDGERLTVVWWEDEETLKVWATDAKHRIAQQAGRDRWYEYYKMDVAQVLRESNFARAAEAQFVPAS